MNAMLWWIDWLKVAQVLQALLAPVIAIAAAVISRISIQIQRRQADTNRLQYRLALFDKRMKVFNSTMDLIAVILREARIEQKRVFQFLHETQEGDLLFGPEIREYLDELYNKASELHLKEVGGRQGEQEDIQKETELLKWFSGQGAVATKKFLKYIDFRET